MIESENAPKKWAQCNHCGHFFEANLTACSKCNQPVGSEPELQDDKPVTLRRALIIGIGIMLIILFNFTPMPRRLAYTLAVLEVMTFAGVCIWLRVQKASKKSRR